MIEAEFACVLGVAAGRKRNCIPYSPSSLLWRKVFYPAVHPPEGTPQPEASGKTGSLISMNEYRRLRPCKSRRVYAQYQDHRTPRLTSRSILHT
ncbi:hypothetical protein ABKN59_002136 [Abortiporus biennis]